MQGMLTVGMMMIFQQQGWEKLPPLPDEAGFASMFAGVAGEKLVAAGGANFPDKKPWEGGTKVW
ncbi:MAG: galactose oxidase, partial [Planctomycetia bacterium]